MKFGGNLFENYLNEKIITSSYFSIPMIDYILDRNVNKIVHQMYNEYFWEIIKRKTKKLYYKFFTKRL